MAVLGNTLYGLFTEIYGQKLVGGIAKANYELWQPDPIGYVHPLTFEKIQGAVKKLREANVPTYDQCENKASEETPLQRELDHRKYTVSQLRDIIAKKKEELRIQLALLAAVKKLANKGGK